MRKTVINIVITTGLVLTTLTGLWPLLEHRAVRASTTGQARPAPHPVALPGSLELALVPFASGLDSPVSLTNAGAGDDRLFVVEQAGVIKIVQPDGSVLPAPFLDISGRVDSSASEEGLLGLAFHPDYARNGYFYVNYTYPISGGRRTHISRFSVSNNPDIADPDSEKILLTVNQPGSNHNAGDIHFGPGDGYLYIPLGDGGGGGSANAQNMSTLLGKIIRIDVDATSGGHPPDCQGSDTTLTYTIPPGNPLIDGSGATCDEIWAAGFRNPWRSSFDRLTGDLYLGDVGQRLWEEIDFQAAGSNGGENYGWRCYEGNHEFMSSDCGPKDTYTFPVFEYSSEDGIVDGCAVIGGYVYRGSQYGPLYGRYFLADFCTGKFWDLVRLGGGDWHETLHTNLATPGIVSFGEDAAGELYVVKRSGEIFRLVDANGPSPNLTPSRKIGSAASAAPGDTITYTIELNNVGSLSDDTIFLTDTLPAGLAYVTGSFTATAGMVDDTQQQVLYWQGPLTPSREITLTYLVTVTGEISSNLTNEAQLGGAAIGLLKLQRILSVPGYPIYLPLIFK